MTTGGPAEGDESPLLANIFVPSHIVRRHTTALSSSMKTYVSTPPKPNSVTTQKDHNMRRDGPL
jgi:hypothetical protein